MKHFDSSRAFAPALAAALLGFGLNTARAAITFGDIAPTKSNAGTDFIPGTGIPENQFTIDTAGTGETAALKARDRNTGVPLLQAGNIYYVSAGTDPSNVNRAAWNFDFQFTPITGKVASDYTYEIQADIDPAFGATNFVTISVPNSVVASPMGDSYYPNGTGGSISGGPTYSYNSGWSDATIPFIIGNSQNYTFAHLAGAGFINGTPAEYELRAILRNSVDNTLVASVTAFAVVPEPACAGLLVLGSVAGLMRRRRHA